MSHDEMSETFKKWNEGELDSFLIEISANILNYRDESGDILLEKIKDSAGQKGTGRLSNNCFEKHNLNVLENQESGQQSLPWSTGCPSP